MPVPSGYGKGGLDYEGCLNGIFFAIEAKAPGETLTKRQRDTALAMLAGGGTVYVISSEEGLDTFRRWVDRCRALSIAIHAANCSLAQQDATQS
jgi:hypothetical protein